MTVLKCKIIYKPRKFYKCIYCGEMIDSKHIYLVAVDGSDFCYGRIHIECHEDPLYKCKDCRYFSECHNGEN